MAPQNAVATFLDGSAFELLTMTWTSDWHKQRFDGFEFWTTWIVSSVIWVLVLPVTGIVSLPQGALVAISANQDVSADPPYTPLFWFGYNPSNTI